MIVRAPHLAAVGGGALLIVAGLRHAGYVHAASGRRGAEQRRLSGTDRATFMYLDGKKI